MMCIDGNCEIVSWKYPDKLMKDIEIDTCTLVETWDKYVLLLELIIDRLYQVMCLSTTIMDSLPQLSNTFKLPKNIQRTSSISLGSVASFFWKRLQVLMIPKNLLSKSSINTEKTNEGTHIANCSEAMELWINAIDFDLKKLTTFSNKNSLKSKDYKKELDLMKVSNDRNIEILRLAQIKYANLEKQYKDDKNQIRDLTELNNTLEQKYNKIAADLKLSAESCTKVEDNSKIVELTEELYKAKEEIEEYKEREIFLVRYPDLNGKMDPFQDMEQQLVANEIRIHLLQEQNVSLRRTVSKMKAINSSTRVDCSRKCDDNGQHRSF
ncbi:hypothetical protein CBL_00745 [Carabus blaptoides fortunei]